MIKELEGKYLFFQDDPILNEYFFDRTLTETEEKKMDELDSLFSNIHRKIYGINRNTKYIGYLDNYGYYEMHDADRGYYSIMPHGDNPKELSFELMKSYLFDIGREIELQNRHKLEEEFINQYGSEIRYSCLFYPVTYALSKWNIYYDGNIPKDVIDDYEGYLNYIYKEDNVEWHYDNINSFNCKKIERTNQYAK